MDSLDPDTPIKKRIISCFTDNDKFEFIHGDIRDRELLKKAVDDVDYIFHEAALVSVEESMKNPVKTMEVNAIGTFNVLHAALESGVRKVIIASSAAVYGNSPELPKKETMTPAPLSPYAISKLDSEYAALLYHREYGLRTTSLRYFNVYGPGQDPSSPYAAVIPIFIHKALKNESLTIYGDGHQTRDFIFINDVVLANELVISKGDGSIFNVANGSPISINMLADKIIRLTGSNSEIKYTEPRKGDVKYSTADIGEIKRIGFKPRFDLEKGLKYTIDRFC
jgi:UDP-glucose 4-epimerase